MAGEVTLESAYNELDPKPLTYGELSTLFVERPNARTKLLVNELKTLKNTAKFLFIGHLGNGKSTELKDVSRQLKDVYVSVFAPLNDVFKSGSLSHDELMYCLYSRIMREVINERYLTAGILDVTFKKYLQPKIDDLTRVLFGAEGVDLSLDQSTAKLDGGFASLEIKLTNDSSLREKLKGKASDLGRVINRIVAQIESKTRKKVLLIVEDIDKYDLDATKALFVEHTGTLLLPEPTTIYTFPVAMKFADEFTRIEQTFKSYELPNIPTFKRDHTPDKEGRAALREIITRRANEMLFAPEALDAIVLKSGNVREMILLARDAINIAIALNKQKVELGHVDEAFNEVCLRFQSLMTPEDYTVLPQFRFAEVRKSPQLQRYLYNLMVMEYRNGESWCNLHPAVDFILSRNEQRTSATR